MAWPFTMATGSSAAAEDRAAACAEAASPDAPRMRPAASPAADSRSMRVVGRRTWTSMTQDSGRDLLLVLPEGVDADDRRQFFRDLLEHEGGPRLGIVH